MKNVLIPFVLGLATAFIAVIIAAFIVNPKCNCMKKNHKRPAMEKIMPHHMGKMPHAEMVKIPAEQ